MAIEREVRWTARATLRALSDSVDPRDQGLRGVLPTTAIAEGTLAEMVGRVMALPVEQRWRYGIASDAVPYLTSEEIASLAAQPGFANA